jgi:hypothetical protein
LTVSGKGASYQKTGVDFIPYLSRRASPALSLSSLSRI